MTGDVDRPTGTPVGSPQSSEYDWDVFVSYASEDVEAVVRPLVSLLTGLGLSVWWDRFELKIGDSLSGKIALGLSRSKFGVLVLSPSFLAKPWPDYELRGLTAREIVGEKVVLPIWFQIGYNDLVRINPTLAEKRAHTINTESLDRDLIGAAIEVTSVAKPEILTRLHREMTFEAMQREATTQEVDPKELSFGFRRHAQLPPDLTARVRLIRAVLLPVDPHTMDHWVAGFCADAHPSREIAVWERIAYSFLEYAQYRSSSLTHPDLKSAFSFLLSLTLGGNPGEIELSEVVESDRWLLAEIMTETQPALEIDGKDEVTPEAWNTGLDEDSDRLAGDFAQSLTADQVEQFVAFYRSRD